jgi:hypothetical protein
MAERARKQQRDAVFRGRRRLKAVEHEPGLGLRPARHDGQPEERE